MTSARIIPVRDAVCKIHIQAISDVTECRNMVRRSEGNSIGYPLPPAIRQAQDSPVGNLNSEHESPVATLSGTIRQS